MHSQICLSCSCQSIVLEFFASENLCKKRLEVSLLNNNNKKKLSHKKKHDEKSWEHVGREKDFFNERGRNTSRKALIYWCRLLLLVATRRLNYHQWLFQKKIAAFAASLSLIEFVIFFGESCIALCGWAAAGGQVFFLNGHIKNGLKLYIWSYSNLIQLLSWFWHTLKKIIFNEIKSYAENLNFNCIFHFLSHGKFPRK